MSSAVGAPDEAAGAELRAEFRAWVATLPALPGVVRAEPGPVAHIVLDAPTTRNALHPGMMVGFADAVEAVKGARVVVLRGEHGTFCSGGDLGAVRDHLARPGSGRLLASFMQAATEALAGLDAPVLGVLTGAALGGGAELLTACDVVYAAPGGRIGWVQAALGVSPGFGGGTRLVQRVGAARALQLLADARLLGAEEALAAGLVDAVADDPLALALTRAERWAALPPESLRAALAVVRAAARLPRGEALMAERAAFDGVWGGPAHRAALDRPKRR